MNADAAWEILFVVVTAAWGVCGAIGLAVYSRSRR
jgi:hypothetical protein